MKLTTNSILFIFGILALLMLACIPITLISIPLITSRQATPVDSLATVQAMFTPTMLPPTLKPPTVLPPTAMPIPTNTPAPTAAPVTYCDWAMFVGDVTVPDATSFSAGETFTKTWRVKNRGTCSWSPDYMLAFTGGDQMGGTTAIRLPAYVSPGQSVDVSVTLTAPSKSGHYVGYWILRNPAGVLFGSGDKADKPFYVDIYAQEELPHGTVTGNICYPSEFIPAMTLYFEKVSNGEAIQFSIPENNMNFSFLLPNDTYYVRAVSPNYGLEGAYVNADRTMKSFVVRAGQTTSGIGICDWDVTPHSRGQ